MSLLEGVRFPGAACAGVDPDLFFPERGEAVDAAKAICAQCSHRVECLEAALDAGEVDGVWGGESARTRRALRAARSRDLGARVLGLLGAGGLSSEEIAERLGWGEERATAVMQSLSRRGLVVQSGVKPGVRREVRVWAVKP